MDIEIIDLLKNPSPEVIEILINARALSKEPNECGHTALHLVARYKATTPEVIRTLIEAGPKIGVAVNAQDKAGCTALHFAARKNPDPEVIEVLLNAGAEVNAQDKYGDWTPLHFATKENPNPKIIEVLLNAGAQAWTPDKAGKTPWDYAQYNKNLKGSEAYWRLNKARIK